MGGFPLATRSWGRQRYSHHGRLDARMSSGRLGWIGNLSGSAALRTRRITRRSCRPVTNSAVFGPFSNFERQDDIARALSITHTHKHRRVLCMQVLARLGKLFHGLTVRQHAKLPREVMRNHSVRDSTVLVSSAQYRTPSASTVGRYGTVRGGERNQRPRHESCTVRYGAVPYCSHRAAFHLAEFVLPARRIPEMTMPLPLRGAHFKKSQFICVQLSAVAA